MKNIFLKTGLTLLCLIIGLGSAWGDTYTIDFNKGTTNGTNISSQLAANVETMCSSGYENAISITGTNCYYNSKGCGIRLAKSSGNGSLVVTFSSTIQIATVQKVIVYASAVESGNTMTVTPAGTVTKATEFSDLSTYSTSNSASTNYQLSEITINGTLTSLTFGATSKKYVMLHRIDVITGAAKTLSSIAVKTAPNKVTYTEGEMFDPAGLVITGTYSDSSTEDIAYADHAGDFTFSPTLSTALTTSNTSVTITYGSKTTTQSITVNEVPKHTANFNSNGSLYTSEQYTEGAAITFPTGLDDINGKKFMGWVSSPIDGTTNSTPSFVTSATMGESDVTYYAVYATQGTGGGSPGYQNVTSLTVGKTYVFGSVNAAASSNLAANTEIGAVAFSNAYNSTSPNWGTAIKVTPNEDGFIASSSYKYSSEEALTRWTLEAIDNGNYKFKNGSNYIFLGDKTGSTSNGAQAGISSTGNVYIENVNSTCANAFLLHPSSTSTNIMLWNTSNGYRMYALRSYTAAMTPYVRFYEYTDGTSYSDYCTTIGSETPTITAESTLSLPASESDGTFNVTWTNVEEYDSTLYADDACTSKIEDCDWLIIELTSSKNIDYYASANISTSPRTVYMRLYGVAADGTTDATKVVTITQAGKQASDPTISNFIKTSSIELTVGADPYDVRQCLNIPNDYDTSTYAITTKIDGLTQKDNEYACVYPYLSFQKAGTYTVHVVAAAMPGKYAQTEGDITVNVTAPAPTITTIPDLFTKATEVGGTETDINITFNNWVVSGATTSNAYVTDSTNGFIIYQSGHGFTAGNVLNGTVDCKVKLYNGAAEIVGLTSTTTGLTVSTSAEELTPTVISNLTTLSGVNTGALIKINNVQYDGTNFTDGTNDIKPYTSIMNTLPELTNGAYYNVTGVYVQYNSTKEIAPRSAEDIEEVQAEKYAINIASCENGTITASLEEAAAGVEVTLTVTPNSGYQLSTLAVTNASTSEEITVTGNKFIMPAANVNVTATFEEKETPGTYTYNLVTDASTLAAGDVIVLGCSSYNKAAGAKSGDYLAAVDATISNGILTSDDAIEITLGTTSGAWTLTYSDGTIGATAAKKLSLTTGTTTWNISIANNGTATIENTTTTYGQLQYNNNNGTNPRFLNYTSSQTAIQIYKKTLSTPKTLTSITLDGQTTEFTEGDDFEFGGTVTAHYDDESTKDVTSSATFSGYDMSTAGTQTVTVSYTEGGVTKEASYNIIVNAVTKYTVTIETPENGTLVVMHGDDVVKTGDKFAEGETLNITATPAAGYKFRNWQAVDGTTHTFTSGTTWTMSASDVTIKANFDLADQKYLISWNVNGTVTNQQVNAGSALEAPTMTGKTLGTREFAGWTEDALVKNDTIPTYVTLGTATKDVTYYAVFADREEVTAAVPTSITAYADGNYYIVDKFVVEGITRYYALDGAVNSAGSIIPTDITDAVTLNDGRITIDETNPVIKDAMKYNLANINDEYVLTHLLSGKVIGKGQGEKDNNLSSADSHVNWYHFNANPNDPNTFSLNTTTVEEKEESHALFMQYSTWDSKKQVQVPLPRFRAYAVSNRGAQQEKNAFYSAGYTYFVPATPIALSNFATHEVSVSQYGSTTLCMPEDYVMPEGLTGKIVTANEAVDSKGDGYYTLTFQTKYTAGDIVPAGECLVLSGNQGSYYIAPGETTAKVSDDNLLHGDYVIDTTDSKLRFITTYDEENASSNFYYKLATDKNKENFGWYWGNTTGEPFIMTSNERAYLVIDKGTAGLIRGFALDEFGEEDITTFIEGLTNDEINKSGRIYNLQGQMVNKLQKGINIVNGKKVIR